MRAGPSGKRLGRLQLLLRLEELAGRQSARAHADALTRAREAAARLQRVERAMDAMAPSGGLQNVHVAAGAAHLRQLLGAPLSDARRGADQCRSTSFSTAQALARDRDRARQLMTHVEEARADVRRESEQLMIDTLPIARPRR